jgi:WD40 repeat protein
MRRVDLSSLCWLTLLLLCGAVLGAQSTSRGASPVPSTYRLQVQISHTADIRQLAFLPSGRTLVTGGDSTIRLWDVQSGRLVDVMGGTGATARFALSKDGRRLAVVRKDQASQTLVVAPTSDLQRAEEIPLDAREFRAIRGGDAGPGASDPGWDINEDADVVAFHPTDPNLIALSAVGGLVYFDCARRHITAVAKLPFHTPLIASADGAFVAAAISDEIRVWDVVRRSWIAAVKTPRRQRDIADIERLSKFGSTETEAMAADFILSDDGTFMAARLGRVIHRWVIPSGKELSSLTLFGDPSKSSIAFSPDNRRLAATDDATAVVFDLQTKERVLALNPLEDLADASAYVNAVAFSPDGASLAYGTGRPLGQHQNKGMVAGVIDVAKGSVDRTLAGVNWSVGDFDVAETARKIIVGPDDVEMDRPIWSLNTLSLDDAVLHPAELRNTRTVAIDPRATRVFASGFVWGLSPPKVILPDSVVYGDSWKGGLQRARFLDGGRKVFVANSSRGMELIDIESGRTIWSPAREKFSGVPLVVFSGDESLVAIGSQIHKVGGGIVSSLALPPWGDWPSGLGFINAGQSVGVLGAYSASGGRYYLATFSVADGKLEKLKDLPEGTFFGGAAFDPLGPRAWIGSRKGIIQEWDLNQMVVVREWSVGPGDVEGLRFLREMNCLAFKGAATVRLLQLDSGHLLNLFGLGDDWLAYTEDGYFDASPGAAAYLSVVSGTTVYGIDQFTSRLNRPDIILERFGLGSPAQVAHFRKMHEARLRKLGLKETEGAFAPHVPTVQISAAPVSGREARLSISMRDEQGRVLSYQVFVNGVPVFAGRGKDADGRATVEEAVELSSGVNRVEVSCMNDAGAESFREMVELRSDEPASPQLFFVGLGVSKYANPSLNLGFADKDAQDLAAVFGRMGAPFSKVNVRVYANEAASREAFRQASDWLAAAGVNDTVVLFLAGHGVHDRDPESTYYFLTHEADPAHLAETAVPYDAIEALVAGVRARNRLVLVDTCESGELEEGAVRSSITAASSRGIRARGVPREPANPETAPPPAAVRAARPYLLDRDRMILMDLSRRTGAVVFSASRGNELSYESDAYRNGYFTAGILRTLAEEGKPSDNAPLTTARMRQAVRAWVEQETGDLQHPTVDRDNVYQSIVLPIVKPSK